ncbi:hypothetical protein E2C01_095975 [Portunus trituberculatus]|uniref:Secreted protein n=1 Tax=Portunus trituberculatus TaxID=210409 RepID=A0A5B7K0G9_PORTR|nr:hypothetical protein [Portunus trituberculatus]
MVILFVAAMVMLVVVECGRGSPADHGAAHHFLASPGLHCQQNPNSRRPKREPSTSIPSCCRRRARHSVE